MSIGRKSMMWCMVLIILVIGGGLTLHAASDHHEEKHSGKRGHDNHDGDHDQAKRRTFDSEGAETKAYSAACGSCHMAYPPQLLPAASWREIVSGDHFGAALSLEEAQKQGILKWLERNDADSGSGTLAKKARKHFRGQQVGRITEIAYLQRKHRKIGDEVFNRPGIRSFSNCIACHPGAEQGDFEDDHVRIPGQ